MKCFQLIIKGNWAHFKKPETNNNPLSHDLITKTALIGLMGAVLGIERKVMRELFPILSEDIIYNVKLLKPISKISLGLTSCKANNPTIQGSPKTFEILKNPCYLVTIGLVNERTKDLYENFITHIKNYESIYPPCLGWHNCPAELHFVSQGDLSDVIYGEFETDGFVPVNGYKIKSVNTDFRIGFDRIPTYQNNDFWNLPNKYCQVVYSDVDCKLTVEGKYREYVSGNSIENLCLI